MVVAIAGRIFDTSKSSFCESNTNQQQTFDVVVFKYTVKGYCFIIR